jgi:hypothetical protein
LGQVCPNRKAATFRRSFRPKADSRVVLVDDGHRSVSGRRDENNGFDANGRAESWAGARQWLELGANGKCNAVALETIIHLTKLARSP